MKSSEFTEDLYWGIIDISNGLLTGTVIGGYYAMISIGLAMTFGVMRLVNLAHGDFIIVGAYLSVVFLNLFPISPFFALIIVVPVMFCLGYLLQRVLLNHVSVQAMERKGLSSNYGLMAPILVTFGLGIFLSHLLLGIFESDARQLKNSLAFSAVRLSEDLNISLLRFIFFIIGILILVVLHLFLNRTQSGRAIRAASDNADISPLMGINTAHVYGLALGISMAIAGVAGVMIGMIRTFQPFDGPQFLLIAFGAVIIGGLGSIVGSLVGGVLLGITQVLAGTYFGPSAQLVGGYILILFVLAFKPQGLFSR